MVIYVNYTAGILIKFSFRCLVYECQGLKIALIDVMQRCPLLWLPRSENNWSVIGQEENKSRPMGKAKVKISIAYV